MELFLRKSLLKSDNKDSGDSGDSGSKASKRGEQRGGNYVARVQVGYEPDGSPKYKYFKTIEERDKYLQNRGTSQANIKRDLKRKVKREQKESKEKQDASYGKVEGRGSPSKKKDKVNKSLSINTPLFIWSLE